MGKGITSHIGPRILYLVIHIIKEEKIISFVNIAVSLKCSFKQT